MPFACRENLARATCAGHYNNDADRLRDDPPLLGSFTALGFVFTSELEYNIRPGHYVPEIQQIREKYCPGTSYGNGNLALLGIEVPTIWQGDSAKKPRRQSAGVLRDDFWWAAEVLKFTVPYSSAGYQVETERGCEVRPALPEPGAPRPLLAAYLGTDFTPLRERLSRECEAAPDCANYVPRKDRWIEEHAYSLSIKNSLSIEKQTYFRMRDGREDMYLNATFALQPPGDTATRKGYWDALAAGAINVLFSDDHADQVFADALIAPHAAYTVTVPYDVHGRGETLQYLRAIPAARVLELQRAAARVRHRATYTAKGQCHDDAASAIATGLARRFRAYRAAMCYARRYPELARWFCDQRPYVVECDSVALRGHFDTRWGREAHPKFGCHHREDLNSSVPSKFDSFLKLSEVN